MTQHCITAHYGYDHVSAHDAALIQALIYGSGRYLLQGLTATVPNSTTLHINNGIALLDGRWYLITGNGEDLEIPHGSIGMQRKDRVWLVYRRLSDKTDDIRLEYTAGVPSTGTPVAPANEHPGSILDGSSTVWIPFMEIPLSGLTVGRPTVLIGSRAISPPAQQCAECADMQRRMAEALARQEAATAAAWEVVRAVPAELDEMQRQIDGMHTWLEATQAQNEAQIRQLAAMLANNIAAYVMVGDTLAAPSAWVEYDRETETVELAYTSFDEETGEFSIDAPLTVDRRIDVVAAEVDYILMLSGEE